jgi:hypothetical protein
MWIGPPLRRRVASRSSRNGGWRRRRVWRRLGWRFGRGNAEGIVDGFQKGGHVDGLVNVGDRTRFEGGIAIANGSTRAKDDDRDGACVDQHRETLQDDESVAGWDTEIENDEIGLFLAGSANGGQPIAGGNNFETGSFEAASKSGELNNLILDD